MQVTLVVSRFFENTQGFARAVAGHAGVPVVLLKGDETFERGVRAMRSSTRVWFEGFGPLLEQLLDAPRSWNLPRACLRVAEYELARLPLAKLRGRISALSVPEAAAASKLSAVLGRDLDGELSMRVHSYETDLRRQILEQVTPGEDISRLVWLLLKHPGDLSRGTWRSIGNISQNCRGRVLIVGQAPEELRTYLTEACGVEVVDEDPADTSPVDSIVTWRKETDSAAASERYRARLCQAGTPVATGPGASPASPAATTKFRLGGEWPRPAATDEAPRPVRVKAQPPLVSVVVPVYNDADRVDVALWSLRRQTYRDIEILVVDDGSTDGTARAVAKHLNDRRVRYLYKPHSGRPETRNLGVREARGAYVAWLGSDDESLPNRFMKQVEAVRQDPSIDIVHTDGLIFRPDGTLHECRRYKPFTAEEFPRRLMAGFATICPILDTSAMIRRSLYDRIGPYDPAFLRCQDYDFYIRTAMAGDVRYKHIPLALVKVHQNPPTPEKTALMVDFYTRLATKIVDFFGPERLTDPAARDLHLPSCLIMAEYLAAIVTVLKVKPGHTLYERAQQYLKQAITTGGTLDRVDAYRLLGVMMRATGDDGLAELYLARAAHYGQPVPRVPKEPAIAALRPGARESCPAGAAESQPEAAETEPVEGVRSLAAIAVAGYVAGPLVK